MNYEIIQNIFLKKAKVLRDDMEELCNALRLYAYELFSDKTGTADDIDKIKSMVESTSPVLEKLYQEYEGSELNNLKSINGTAYDETIFDLSVFIAVMCVGSRVYENLDPVFSRDIMHAALDAAHFLMVRQFKEADDEGDEVSERNSVILMSSRDDELSEGSIAALLWAYAELLKTDKDMRNAYDHSLMAGMPQKMSRQKRYKLRLSDLIKRLSISGYDKAQNYIGLLLSTVVLLDSEDTFTDEVKRPLYDMLYAKADEADDELSASVALLSLQNELDSDERLGTGASQLIKVVEYNVIGAGKKKMTEEEKSAIKEHMQRLEARLK
ncbi:hypothetical protein [Butyrivibrio sp. INlla16]|uniref:hypothetical protein n=1 Tax=Butyrivibrio sp. INlla16 TaxID=1520807 RepID=UPI00087FFD80|nr:hypothetical protein [Butyrivibrio sp. INlla16]SDB55840.1 hypothetical protein SAMN02910263_02851 [Butyrivibrio sp. INlla16]